MFESYFSCFKKSCAKLEIPTGKARSKRKIHAIIVFSNRAAVFKTKRMLLRHSFTQKIVKKSRIMWLCMLFSVLLGPITAQIQTLSTDELLENFFRDNEQASESDAQQFLENLENYRTSPLNLNRATRNELISLHLINELVIGNFLTYRDKFGPLLNAYELQSIPGLEISDIRRLLEFTTVRTDLDTRNTNIMRGLHEGDNEILMRWGRPDPPNYTNQVEGKPNAWAFRYKHSFDNRLRFGFTAENDPGEAFFSKSNRSGFDFYSAHIFAQNLNRTVKVVALGDYSARFGQGLLLQTGFAVSKSAETTSVMRGGRKVNAYAAFGEAFFFRGAATTLAFGKHLEVTALYSNRRRDGNVVLPDSTDLELPEIAFSSLQSSGLHRSASEIADEGELREQVGGLSATYSWKSGQVSVNGLSIKYDKPWNPSVAAYRKFVFRGRQLNAVSVDYNWRRRNWLLFGETARSDNGAIASVNGLLLSPDQHVTFSAIHRSLARDYQSIYAVPFAETSNAANENGMYIGADIRYIRRWQLNVYADVWRHPWLRFGVNAPSQGRDFLARLLWTKSRSFSVYALWQGETKESDSNTEGVFGLVENRRDRLRLHAIYKASKAVELRSRVEWTTYTTANVGRSQGFIAYQEVVVKPLGFPLTGTIRYAIYDTDNFDTRVFAYESDLFSAISIPAFSGQGSRYYFNLHWRVNRWLRLEARLEQTNQLRAVTSSNITGKERYWKLQARIKW